MGICGCGLINQNKMGTFVENGVAVEALTGLSGHLHGFSKGQHAHTNPNGIVRYS